MSSTSVDHEQSKSRKQKQVATREESMAQWKSQVVPAFNLGIKARAEEFGYKNPVLPTQHIVLLLCYPSLVVGIYPMDHDPILHPGQQRLRQRDARMVDADLHADDVRSRQKEEYTECAGFLFGTPLAHLFDTVAKGKSWQKNVEAYIGRVEAFVGKTIDERINSQHIEGWKHGLLCVCMHRHYSDFPKLVSFASGLNWRKIGNKEPTGCVHLANAGLESGLASTTTFTQEEWDAFGVTDLRRDHFIKSGESYFQPAADHSMSIKRVARLLHPSLAIVASFVLWISNGLAPSEFQPAVKSGASHFQPVPMALVPAVLTQLRTSLSNVMSLRNRLNDFHPSDCIRHLTILNMASITRKKLITGLEADCAYEYCVYKALGRVLTELLERSDALAELDPLSTLYRRLRLLRDLIVDPESLDVDSGAGSSDGELSGPFPRVRGVFDKVPLKRFDMLWERRSEAACRHVKKEDTALLNGGAEEAYKWAKEARNPLQWGNTIEDVLQRFCHALYSNETVCSDNSTEYKPMVVIKCADVLEKTKPPVRWGLEPLRVRDVVDKAIGDKTLLIQKTEGNHAKKHAREVKWAVPLEKRVAAIVHLWGSVPACGPSNALVSLAPGPMVGNKRKWAPPKEL
jgi:hypothetical protein